MTKRLVVGVVFLFEMLLVPLPLFAQKPQLPVTRTGKEPSLSLGTTEAVPDTEAMIPVIYFPKPGEPVPASAKVHVCVPEGGVSFEKVTVGMAGEAGKAEATAQKTEKKGDSCGGIDVATTFKAPPINGTLLQLFFKVDKQAPIDTSVPLEGTFEIAGGSGEKVEDKLGAGEIKIVATMPVFSCFFYMH
jgi:hypothetical protein